MAQVSIWVLRTFHVASRKLMKHPWTWRFCSASASRTEWKNCENTRKASISAQLWWWYFRSGSLSLFGAIRKIALLHVASEQLLPQMFHWACPQGAPREHWGILKLLRWKIGWVRTVFPNHKRFSTNASPTTWQPTKMEPKSWRESQHFAHKDIFPPGQLFGPTNFSHYQKAHIF